VFENMEPEEVVAFSGNGKWPTLDGGWIIYRNTSINNKNSCKRLPILVLLINCLTQEAS
jgi:hypothetical protein